MATVYTSEQLAQREFKDEQFKDVAKRDIRARQLRQEGWTVTCKEWVFADLAGEIIYSIRAEISR